jgi:Protein of unknown function (DUF3175)
VARSSSGICLQRARQGEVLQKWRNIGQFRRCWAGSQTVGGAPDENCFTMSRTGGMGVKSAPCLKSKRRFRLRPSFPVRRPHGELQEESLDIQGQNRLHTSTPEALYAEGSCNSASSGVEEVSPKGPASSMRMLTYFINRAGQGLSPGRRGELEKAKSLLSKRIQRSRRPTRRKAA